MTVHFDQTVNYLLWVIQSSPRPLCKTELLARTQGQFKGVSALDRRLDRLLRLGLVEELRRGEAAKLGAYIHNKVPSTLYYRERRQL